MGMGWAEPCRVVPRLSRRFANRPIELPGRKSLFKHGLGRSMSQAFRFVRYHLAVGVWEAYRCMGGLAR